MKKENLEYKTETKKFLRKCKGNQIPVSNFLVR